MNGRHVWIMYFRFGWLYLCFSGKKWVDNWWVNWVFRYTEPVPSLNWWVNWAYWWMNWCLGLGFNWRLNWGFETNFNWWWMDWCLDSTLPQLYHESAYDLSRDDIDFRILIFVFLILSCN